MKPTQPSQHTGHCSHPPGKRPHGHQYAAIPSIPNPSPSDPSFDTSVSYDPATATRQIRHLPDTNNLSPDTKSVEMSNAFLSGPATQPAQDSLSTPRRNPPTPQSPPFNRPCYTCVSYGPATTMLLMLLFSDTNRHFSDTRSVARVSPSLSGPWVPTDQHPHTTPRRNPLTLQPPQCPSVELVGPIRASYGSGTNGTLPRYKQSAHSYGRSSTPYLAWNVSPLQTCP